MPKNIIPAASATTMNRNLRLDPTIARIMVGVSSALPTRLLTDPELGPEELDRAHGHDPGAGGRAVQEHRRRPGDVVDVDPLADEGQGAGLTKAQVSPCSS